MWVDIFLAIFTVLLGVICIIMSYASFRIVTHKVPSVPTGKNIRDEMFALAQLTENQVVYDLGCGFGGILFSAHKQFPRNNFTGFDVVDPIIWWAQLKAKILGRKKIAFVKKDFFSADITDANVIFCYLWPSIMARIETEIWPTLKPGTKVISHAFKLPNIKPETVTHIGKHKVYLYIK